MSNHVMPHNPILDTDSYKTGHFLQYPPGTEKLFGYFESRGGRYGETVCFGMQGFVKENLLTPINQDNIDEAEAVCKEHGDPFPRAGWQHILNRHGGYLPVRIRAIPEGSVVPVRNALFTVESLDPVVPWAGSWLETKSMRLWYPTTVATRSFYCKKVIFEALRKTADDPLAELPFKLHDFGGRGVTGRQQAGLGGAAHLVNFLGTDTLEAHRYVRWYYGSTGPISFSIPAMEHSTVTAWGPEGEEAAFRNMLRANKDFPIVACVSDSYDFFGAVEHLWGDRLLEEVKASGKTVVIRPDSGDASEVNLRALQILERKVGMTLNSKGYKVLPKYYRLIQGDGNDTEDDIRKVLVTLENNGYSASNIAFGMGGGLLQKLDRDTQRSAFKNSEITINGVAHKTQKKPKTDDTKASKAGRLDTVCVGGVWETRVLAPGAIETPGLSEMKTVYETGELKFSETFDQIRERAGRSFR